MPSIAIVGAGPAGLTLARLLKVASTPELSVTIFEKDASPDSRLFQGGTLDLHPETGIAAMKKAQIWEEMVKHMRYDAEETVFGDKNGTELVHLRGGEQGKNNFNERPEIDREKLKELLLKSVGADSIRWGKNLRFVDGENRKLRFEDGEEAGPFDLIVGAEGGWSKVRNVLTDVRPHYSGICGFESQIAEPAKTCPDLSAMVGRGSYFMYSDGRSIMAQRMANESLKVAAWARKDEDYATNMIGNLGTSEENLKADILADFNDWLPEIKQLVQTSTRFRPWPLYELPVGHTWDHKKGFTLIGDAASLMTPFAGEGVNKALKDALELAEAIMHSIKTGEGLDEAVKIYEKRMFPRSKKVQGETMLNKTYMFKDDAPVGFMVVMMGVLVEKFGYDINKGLVGWIPITKMAWLYFTSITVFGRLRRRARDLFSRA